jgi:hypothetical protein
VDVEVGIATAPAWALDRLGAATKAQDEPPAAEVPEAAPSTVERAAAWLASRAPAIEGMGGDAHTFETAAFLRDYGLSKMQAFALLQDGWNQRCSPPWDLDALWDKVVNAYRYADGAAGSKAVTAADFPDLSEGAPAEAPKPAKPSKSVSFHDIVNRPAGDTDYLVKGLLYQGAYSMLYGAHGQGKTFLALDMAYHVAAGLQWMGRRVKKGPVLYIGFEAFGGLGNRARALKQKYSSTNVPLYFAPGGFDLRQPEGRQLLGRLVAELPVPPVLIVLDTFAYALAGGDENSAQDVGSFNSAVQALIEHTKAGVLLLHHTGKDANKGARGSSALPAAIDTELEVADRTLTPTKQRDVELGETVPFALRWVQIGIDADGDAITSCVVDPRSPAEEAAQPKQGSHEARVWAVLCEARPTNMPILIEELRALCEGFTKNRTTVFDALTRLRQKGLIVVDGQQVTRRQE